MFLFSAIRPATSQTSAAEVPTATMASGSGKNDNVLALLKEINAKLEAAQAREEAARTEAGKARAKAEEERAALRERLDRIERTKAADEIEGKRIHEQNNAERAALLDALARVEKEKIVLQHRLDELERRELPTSLPLSSSAAPSSLPSPVFASPREPSEGDDLLRYLSTSVPAQVVLFLFILCFLCAGCAARPPQKKDSKETLSV